MAKLTYACLLTRQIDRLASFYQEVLQLLPRRDGAYIEFSTEPGIFCLWTMDAYAEIAGSDELPQPGGRHVERRRPGAVRRHQCASRDQRLL